MRRWKLIPCKTGKAKFYLNNRTKTLVKVHAKTQVDPQQVIDLINDSGFPLAFSEGVRIINFTYMKKKWFGDYDPCTHEIRVDAKKKHRVKTLVETVVHEIAHHVDIDNYLADQLTGERKRKGRHIHRRAISDDSEYLARGFERFYRSESKRRRLRELNPKLYYTIVRLHKQQKY